MMQQSHAIKVFCCYAHKDKDLLDELQRHLSPLGRQNVIRVWHDGDISAGTEWDQEIKKHLSNANIILLLISPDFIHSDYCYSKEMQHALKRHKQKEARVIPIILRPVSGWEKVPPGDIQLGQLQALPENANPVTSWADHDKVWKGIAERIEGVVNELLMKEPVPDVKPPSGISRRIIVAGLAGTALAAAGSISILFWTHVLPFSPGTQPKQVVQKWAFLTGGDVRSSPVVVNGVLYVGSYDGNMYALDADTGQQKWAFSMGGEVLDTPLVFNDLLYISSYPGVTLTHPSMLYALDTNTGRPKWTFSASSYYPYVSPMVANGTLYVSDVEVDALDASTGQQKQTFTVGYAAASPPAVIDGALYVGSTDHKVYAIDASTGQQRWVFYAPPIVASPTLANGGPYADLLKPAFSTSAVVFYSTPIVSNGILYIRSTDGVVYALDASAGQQKWAFPTDSVVPFSSPTVSNGTLYIGTDDGKVYALDASTGQRKWVFSTGGGVHSSPAVVNGVLYIGSDDHKVYALDANTGQQKWAFPTGGYLHSSPTVVNGMLYIGSGDHKVYALTLPAS